jgi:hypothetical protein
VLRALDTINEDTSLELAQLPQSTPHPRWHEPQDMHIHEHLLDQFSLSFQVDPEVLDDGDDTECGLPDNGGVVEGKESNLYDLDADSDYREDDTFIAKPAELPVQAPAAMTKPRGRGRPRKDQGTSGMDNAKVVPKRAQSKARSKSVVSESDEESSDVAESGESTRYLCIFLRLTLLC